MKKLRTPTIRPLVRALIGALIVGLCLSRILPHDPAPEPTPTRSHADAPPPGDAPLTQTPPRLSAIPTALPPVEEPKAPTPDSCFSFEYQHPVAMKTRDLEDFLDYSNVFPLEAVAPNPKSICVKVDGRPVEFQLSSHGGKKEIVIGPVVGPESVIRISYCTTHARCTEACAKPKKRFMDDLLDDAHADEFQDSWGKNSHDADSRELRNKTRELETLAHEPGSLADHAMMRNWNTLSRQVRTCRKD